MDIFQWIVGELMCREFRGVNFSDSLRLPLWLQTHTSGCLSTISCTPAPASPHHQVEGLAKLDAGEIAHCNAGLTPRDARTRIKAGELDLQSIGFRLPIAALYTGTWLVEQA
jgi:hypothetical protein